MAQVGIGPSGNTQTIVDIPQGITEQNRIGRKCTITNILARLNFEFLLDSQSDMTASNDAHETVRFIMFWDKQANGGGAGATDLLETDTYNSFRNLANAKRFVFLVDKLMTFNTTASSAGNGTTNKSERIVRDYQIKINKKVFIPIEYNSTAGAITEMTTNNVGCIVFSKHGARMKLDDSAARIRYIDF